MKERPSEANTPRCKVKVTHELSYEMFDGTLDEIKFSLDRLIKDGWEGIEVASVFWNRGAVYRAYRHRLETGTEYENRLKGLQGKYDSKLKQLKALQEEFGQ